MTALPFRHVAAAALVGALATAPFLLAQQQPRPGAINEKYATLCASCHGDKLQGNQAPSMLDDTWVHGGDDASLAASIRDGRLATGMPAFGSVLSDEEIRAMVIFIREMRSLAAVEGAGYAKPAADTVVDSEKHRFRLETVTEDVKIPWGLAFLPDGRMLVAEKEGTLRYVDNGTVSEPISGIPAVWAKGQGGLMDVAPHPDYASNGWLYLSYSDPGEGDSAMTAVVRGKLRDGAFVDQQELFKVPQALYRTGNVHFGSRFVFDNGYLFFSIGERGQMQDAQDLSRPNGKVHRIHDDGRVPQDNPFVGRADAMATIWTYGNRNPQGLAKHPVTGELFGVEHGPRGGDELNHLRKGLNYGWPVITYGMNYNGTPMTDKTHQEGMEQPVIHWTPSIAVSSTNFYTGDRFPEWKHDLFVASLAQQELRRLEMKGTEVTHQEVLFRGVGRLRDIIEGPDGHLYIAFNNPDRIARIVPAAAGSASR
jgi:aldose sugar dehydrogenase